MNYMKMIALAGMAIFISTAAAGQDFKYIGAAKCKMCHNKPEKGEQYNKWAAGPHANALKVLSEAERKDPKCVKCHSTAAAVDASLIETLTFDEGISCESCHGPGSAYKAIPVMKDRAQSIQKGLILPDEKVCRKCHNAESPHYKEFNFEEFYAKIKHTDPTLVK